MLHRLLCRLGLHVWGDEIDYEEWSLDWKYGTDCAICGATRKQPPYPKRSDPFPDRFFPPTMAPEVWREMLKQSDQRRAELLADYQRAHVHADPQISELLAANLVLGNNLVPEKEPSDG